MIHNGGKAAFFIFNCHLQNGAETALDAQFSQQWPCKRDRIHAILGFSAKLFPAVKVSRRRLDKTSPRSMLKT